MSDRGERRTISVRKKIYGAPAPRPFTAVQRRRRDYPGVSEHHLDAAEALSSPLLMGPPLCDELVAFVRHLLTEEEAAVFKHLGIARARSAADVARAARVPVAEAEAILRHLAFERFCISGEGGEGGVARYRMLPVVPGIFEMVLIGQHLETMSPWHRRFAELFEALFGTGYVRQYGAGGARTVRFVPVREVLGSHPAALPSDRLEVIFDRFDRFAVGQCQCRMAATITGHGCGRPVGNCMAMGEWARSAIAMGQMREVSRETALALKIEAEALGMVNWIMNVESTKGQACCSCCGCCCHALRMVNEFSVPAMAAPPHFLPRFDRAACTYCGKCAKACPLGALVVDAGRKQAWQLPDRCVGCGQCVLACDKQRAIAMEPVPDYRLPPDSWLAMVTSGAPGAVRSALGAAWARSPVSTWWKG